MEVALQLRGNRLAVLNGLGHQLKQHRRKETLGLVAEGCSDDRGLARKVTI